MSVQLLAELLDLSPGDGQLVTFGVDLTKLCGSGSR
jgi:hypothetical protein